jgi:hypothetical protein
VGDVAVTVQILEHADQLYEITASDALVNMWAVGEKRA